MIEKTVTFGDIIPEQLLGRTFFQDNPKNIKMRIVLKAAMADGGLKKPNFFNRLGFGKRKYSRVYLVIDINDDYHWYRQDKGGKWSHKPGITPVINTDASKIPTLIRNPKTANHFL